ncbi:MAG: ribosome biogenesis GTPase YlqF [Clostridia bacterium]|nr:ribosome biogenesis GTPase YlqF [Clostridia bacterium]
MRDSNQNLNWFPGHMAKTRRQITEQLKLCDAVVEIVDARIPLSSRNPEINKITSQKPRIMLLNKCDYADANQTGKWVKYFEDNGMVALPVDCKTGKGLNAFKPAVYNLLKARLDADKAKGYNRSLRLMIVGIPNVGKSSFINRMAGGAKAKVEDRPGVTRSNGWYKIDSRIDLLDTPGVLWPKFDDEQVALKLAFTGAIKDQVTDVEDLAVRLLAFMADNYPQMLMDRYGIERDEPYEMLCAVANKRGLKARGNQPDTMRASVMLLDEYRGGKIGRITLDECR